MKFNKQKISQLITLLYQSLTSDLKQLLLHDKEIRFMADNDIIRKQGGETSFIEDTDKGNVLKEVSIINIPYLTEKEKMGAEELQEKVWIIHKWDESVTNIFKKIGLYNNNKGADAIIFHYKEGEFFVYLVELKSSVSLDTLKHIQGKIEETISKISFFIPIIAYANNIPFDDAKVHFKTIVFFNNRGVVGTIDEVPEDAKFVTDLLKAYNNKKKGYIGTTAIRNSIFNIDENIDKIDVRFIHFQDNGIVDKISDNQHITIDFERMTNFQPSQQ